MTRARKILLSLVVMGIAAIAVGAATWSAFSGTAANPGNSFSAGTVWLSDNDAGSALLSLTSATPGASTSGCIRVAYGGSLPADVRLYASTTGGLDQYLTLTITRGSDASPSFPSCSGFTPDAANYLGAGAGVVYTGALSSFASSHSDFASGLADAPGAPATWNQNDAHSYKLVVTLPSGVAAAAQGLSSSATFSWEARNQ